MRLVGAIKQHRYELIALLTGAAVMMLEIVGARLIAPYFGASTYVWTAMIGVILGALALGFYFGGRLADRDEPGKDLGIIICGAALAVVIMVLLQEPVLRIIANQSLDLRLSAVLAAIVLFGVPSFLIGMVSPHLAKIRVTSLKTTGATVGRLEAAGSLGSITGTFLSGYVLLAYMGARNLSLGLAIMLILTSFLAGWRQLFRLRLGLIAVTTLLLLYNPLPAGIISDVDSAYSRYQVRETTYQGRPVRYLLMDSYSIQSASYVGDETEPVLPYMQSMLAAAQGFGPTDKVLVIGGGAHTLPNILQTKTPAPTIDVVEIDPALEELSRRYFGFEQAPGTRLFYEDGRSFLNRHQGGYDIIFMDAYSSLTPPFHLSSRQSVERLKANLNAGGVVVANAAASYYGGFLSSLERTYASVFDYTASFAVSWDRPLENKQNFIIIASNSQDAFEKTRASLGKQLNVPPGGNIFTDDYAPVERLSY